MTDFNTLRQCSLVTVAAEIYSEKAKATVAKRCSKCSVLEIDVKAASASASASAPGPQGQRQSDAHSLPCCNNRHNHQQLLSKALLTSEPGPPEGNGGKQTINVEQRHVSDRMNQKTQS